MMIELQLNTVPDVANVVRVAFPDYRKKKVFAQVFPERGQNINSYWDGGSKDVFTLVHLETKQRLPLPTQSHPYFDIVRGNLANASNEVVSIDSAGNITLKYLPENVVLIRCGTFCGKPSTAHIYFHPVNAPKYLPAK